MDRAVPVFLGAGAMRRDVLEERRAIHEPQALHSEADTQDGDVPVQGPPGERQVVFLLGDRGLVRRWMGAAQPEGLRMEIVAPCEDDPVDPVEQGLDLFVTAVGVAQVRRDRDGDTARTPDGVDVPHAQPQHRIWLVEEGVDGDEGRFHGTSTVPSAAPMLLAVLYLIAGFVFLAKSADALVEGAATLATRFGMDRWVVGLTVVAWGTSLPEVVVSSLAAYEGSPGLALGNVLGSNVANAGLVLGAVGLILPRALVGKLSMRESLPLVLSLGILYFVLRDGVVSRIEAGSLFALFVIYTVELLFFRGRGKQSPAAVLDEGETHATHPWLRTILGSIGIGIGAQFVILGAKGISEKFGLDDGFVGIFIFALGTSLPELTAGIASARKGQAEIGLGNIVGSNVFNTLAVVGISALVRPFKGTGAEDDGWPLAVENALERDMPVNVAFALFLVFGPPLFRGRLARQRAALLLIAWIGYIVWIAPK